MSHPIPCMRTATRQRPDAQLGPDAQPSRKTYDIVVSKALCLGDSTVTESNTIKGV